MAVIVFLDFPAHSSRSGVSVHGTSERRITLNWSRAGDKSSKRETITVYCVDNFTERD